MGIKLYSIVRVDNKCIRDYENINCPYNYTCSKCKSKKIKRNIYGVTKKQLIKKVAQVMFKNAPKETYLPKYIEQKDKILKVAKEIVEFIGVEK